MDSDGEIARAAKLKPIAEIGGKIGIPADSLVPYGHTKAKISTGLPEVSWLAGPKATSCW
jgi:formyltetrahydrofolate synthetase